MTSLVCMDVEVSLYVAIFFVGMIIGAERAEDQSTRIIQIHARTANEAAELAEQCVDAVDRYRGER